MKIQKGDTVTIKKGAAITSTHPQQPSREAGTTYKILVHRVDESFHVHVGYRSYDAEGTLLHETLDYYLDQRTTKAIDKRFGTTDISQLQEHFVESKRQKRPDKSSYAHVKLKVRDSQVVWAGAGGYWCYVSIKDLKGKS